MKPNSNKPRDDKFVVLRLVSHQATRIDERNLVVDSRQSILLSELDDPFSFGEEAGIAIGHNRVDLLLLRSLKGRCQAFGVNLSRDLLQL